jgi:predicted nucleic acid-binding protein
MSVSFDTNVLVYATATLPSSKSLRARELIARAMRAGSSVLLLQRAASEARSACARVGAGFKPAPIKTSSDT